MPALAETPAPAHRKTERIERHGTCRLTLTIDGQDYTVKPIRGPKNEVCGFQLRKAGTNTVYTLNESGSCNCPDAYFAHARCKHSRALEACGLIED
jgi:hypothetical protein